GMESLPKIEKLKADNHLAWFADMEHVLKLKRCWTAVDREQPARVARVLATDEPVPEHAELTAVITATGSTEAARSKAHAQLAAQEWLRQDEVAMATMHLHVEPVHHVTFRLARTARAAWLSLHEAFRS
ncbi:hypothetical protein MMPV_010191, partial [Pyropia vietnamensis]